MSSDKQNLVDLRECYAWFGEMLDAAHAKGRINAKHSRFFIAQGQPLLLDANGDPVLDADGDPKYDWDADPYYYGRVQAYSCFGIPPSQTVAGTIALPLALLDLAKREGDLFFDVLCSDLNQLYAREVGLIGE